ncbi:hypothetical protein HOY80DRAFT_1075774 [Tuber brumale]|nr:hypothetical protein HOY80DRAFT_1075774 [Tuber brumale]
MQNFNDDNDWGDPLPSLQETLELLPELRETAEALGNLRTDPNRNDLKSSGHPGPPTSRAIAPVRTPPYNRTLPNEHSRRVRRPKPDLRGLYTPRPHKNTFLSSEDYKPPSLPTTSHPKVPPKKGSYRAAMAEAKLAIAEKESRLQFTRANESDSDRGFRGRIVNSTALDRHKKLYVPGRDKKGKPAASNSVQRVEKTSNAHSFPIVESSQPAPAPKPIARKRGYMKREYLSTSDSSESAVETKEPSHGAKLSTPWKGSQVRRRTTDKRSTSPPTSQKSTSDGEEASPPIDPEAATGKSRPRRRAAVAAMERARSQLDDPFPGLFAPRRVNRRSDQQKALMPNPTGREPVIKMSESASEEDEIPRPSTSLRCQPELFYKMESIDPEE